MEYFRTEQGQIYADIAYRQLRIIDQYEKLNSYDEKFETTLYITVLQSLLTNYQEFVRRMLKSLDPRDRNRTECRRGIESIGWGISNDCWKKCMYQENNNLENFVKSIRNSLSHPTILNIQSEYPSTGFTTIKDDFGIIKKYRFVDSPDVRNGELQGLTKEGTPGKDGFPHNIQFKNVNRKYYPYLDSKPYCRISIIDLSVKELSSFVKNLANYLAQPVQKNWDGRTIKWLVA